MAQAKIPYYQVPKVLFEDLYVEMPLDTKLLYGILLERYFLSAKNGWLDENSNPYFYYPIRELAELLNVSNNKICKMLKELERYLLIKRVRQGQGKPDIIVLFYFECARDVVKRLQKDDAGVQNLLPKKLQKREPEYLINIFKKWKKEY